MKVRNRITRCRCQAALNAEGVCPFRCPPIADIRPKKRAQPSDESMKKETGFNYERDFAAGMRRVRQAQPRWGAALPAGAIRNRLNG